MAQVVLTGVSRVFPDGTRAVHDLNLTVGDGELLALVGPSGCGKTTTLRLIAGLERLSAGQISIAGQVVNQLPPRQRNVAMVFQNSVLFPHWSVRRNLEFGAKLRQRNSKQQDSEQQDSKHRSNSPDGASESNLAIHEAAERLGIEHLLDRLPGQLSGGEKQRASLGRAIVRKPAVYLFDEPLSNLDAPLRASLRAEIKRHQQSLGGTMIFVTHDQAEALSLGDRIAVMNQGELQQIGSPWDVYDHPRNRFVASFLGSPGMNLLDGQWEVERGEFRTNGVALRMPSAMKPSETVVGNSASGQSGGRVTLGIRAEDIGCEKVAGSFDQKTVSDDQTTASWPGRVTLV